MGRLNIKVDSAASAIFANQFYLEAGCFCLPFVQVVGGIFQITNIVPTLAKVTKHTLAGSKPPVVIRRYLKVPSL